MAEEGKKHIFTYKNVALVILNIAFVATFLTVFYFLYVDKVEAEVVKNQIEYITNDFIDSVYLFIPDYQKSTIKTKLHNITAPDMAKADNDVKNNNKEVMKLAFRTSGWFIGIAVAITILLAIPIHRDIPGIGKINKEGFRYTEILYPSILNIMIVATIEFLFIKYFGSKFMSADVNFVKLKIIETIEKNK